MFVSENKALLAKTNHIRFLALPIPNHMQNAKEIEFSTAAAKLRFCLIFTDSRSEVKTMLAFFLSTFLGLTDWEPWSQCSASCGIGSQYRVRKCTNPSPTNSGLDCSEGRKRDSRYCHPKPCPGEVLIIATHYF